MRVTKVTSKGQVTIPVEVRTELGITEDSWLEVRVDGDEVRMRPIVRVRPLSDDDPIWSLVGVGESGHTDTSVVHDHVLADAEVERWRESS